MVKNSKATTKKNKGGRPPWQPTEAERKLIKSCAMAGFTHEEIEIVVGKDRNTIAKHCRAELTEGEYHADLMVVNRLFRKAIEGDTTAMIFWLKCRRKWKDKHDDEEDKQVPKVEVVLKREAEAQ